MELPGIVHPQAVAVIDADHRVRVNREIFYLSSLAAKREFLKAPHQFAGGVTDPVTGHRFRPSASSPRLDVGDAIYYFTSERARSAFERDPNTHANR